MSVYPELSLSETSNPSKPLELFYFQSKSGRITEVRATDKGQAKLYYQSILMPRMVTPPDIYCFCIPVAPSGYCRGKHCPKMSHWTTDGWYMTSEHAEYVSFFRNVGTDFFTSGRFDVMYTETPTCVESDHEAVLTKPSGEIFRWNPRRFVYTWHQANVVFRTDKLRDNPFHEAMTFMGKLDIPNSVCYYKIYHTLCFFDDDHWDRLGGSLEPTTERPADIIMDQEVRRPTPVRRRRNQYELISLEDIST